MLTRVSSRRALAACVLAAGLVASGAASARTAACAGLENELARLSSRSGGGGRDVERLDRALRGAARQLQALERRWREAQCDGGGFLFSRPDQRVCRALDRDIEATRADIADLGRTRAAAMRGGGDIDARLAGIRRELARNRCATPDYRASSRPDPRYPRQQYDTDSGGRLIPRGTPDRPRYDTDSGGRLIPRGTPDRNGVVDERRSGFFSLLFGGRQRDPRDDYWNERGSYGATYRTLCVRSCDGFFFPISFSTTEERFAGDAAQCDAMCPGTDARLFFHRNPGEDASAMVSLDGLRYSDLENAFRYRTEFDAACTCKAGNMSVAGAYGDGYSGALQPLTGPGRMDEVTTSGNDLSSLGDDGLAVDGEAYDLYAGRYGAAIAPAALPVAKVSAHEDPDTVANQIGGYKPQLAEPANRHTARAGASEAAEPGGVRRVGPEYFVAQ